jgi:hypothetical protein
MPKCLDGGKFTIVGFGDDYMLVTVEGDCPGCISGGGIGAIKSVLGNVNIVFAVLGGMCGPDKAENHLWLNSDEARKLFPECDQYWWKTQRGKSLCLRTFEEVKLARKEGRDLTPVEEDTSDRLVRYQLTGNTSIHWFMGTTPMGVMPDGGTIEVEGDTIKFIDFGYRFVEGMSPISFGPLSVFEGVAIELQDNRMSFIDKKRKCTYTVSDLTKTFEGKRSEQSTEPQAGS